MKTVAPRSYPAKVSKKVAPRSYLVQTEKQGELRRNRRHLYKVPPDVNYQVSKHTIDLDMERIGEILTSNPQPVRTYSKEATAAKVEDKQNRSPRAEEKTLSLDKPPEVYSPPPTGPRRSTPVVKAPKRLFCEHYRDGTCSGFS